MKCPECHSDATGTARLCSHFAIPLHPSKEIWALTKTLELPKEALITGSEFAGRYKNVC